MPEDAALWAAVVQLVASQVIYGFAIGAENPNEMGYCQAVTPDAIHGRRSAVIRSVNRTMIVIGAPIGGLLADGIGYRSVMWIAIAGFALVAALLGLS